METITFSLSKDKKQYNVFENGSPIGIIEIRKNTRPGINAKTLYFSTDGIQGCTYDKLFDAKKYFVC